MGLQAAQMIRASASGTAASHAQLEPFALPVPPVHDESDKAPSSARVLRNRIGNILCPSHARQLPNPLTGHDIVLVAADHWLCGSEAALPKPLLDAASVSSGQP